MTEPPSAISPVPVLTQPTSEQIMGFKKKTLKTKAVGEEQSLSFLSLTA